MTKIRTLVAVLLLFVAGSAFAVPISFIHTGSGSGSIDGIGFELSNFVITATGDTDDVDIYPSGWFIDHLVASIAIDGVGMFEFITGTRTFVNNASSVVGFSREGINGADLFNGPNDPAFAAWDMLSSIGPIFGTGGLLQWTNSDVLTDGGVLVFDGGVSDASFEAIVGVVDIPEPGTLALLGIGLLGIAASRRKKA